MPPLLPDVNDSDEEMLRKIGCWAHAISLEAERLGLDHRFGALTSIKANAAFIECLVRRLGPSMPAPTDDAPPTMPGPVVH
jgi:hypothetical protein